MSETIAKDPALTHEIVDFTTTSAGGDIGCAPKVRR